MVDILEKDLGQLLTLGLISMETGQQVQPVAAQLCRDIAPDSLSLSDAFGINDHMLSAPIARDWVKYNEYDNQGEVGSNY